MEPSSSPLGKRSRSELASSTSNGRNDRTVKPRISPSSQVGGQHKTTEDTTDDIESELISRIRISSPSSTAHMTADSEDESSELSESSEDTSDWDSDEDESDEEESEEDSDEDEDEGDEDSHMKDSDDPKHEEEIINVPGRPKPDIRPLARVTKSSGKSKGQRNAGLPPLLDRLKAFLPRMEAANAALSAEDPASHKMEITDDAENANGKDAGQYIEMNLGLGVLEEKHSDDDSETDSSSEDDDETGEKDVLGKLMGNKRQEKAGIQEIND